MFNNGKTRKSKQQQKLANTNKKFASLNTHSTGSVLRSNSNDKCMRTNV